MDTDVLMLLATFFLCLVAFATLIFQVCKEIFKG